MFLDVTNTFLSNFSISHGLLGYIMRSIRKAQIQSNDVFVSLVLTAEGVFVDRTLRGPNNGMLSPDYTAQHSTDWG